MLWLSSPQGSHAVFERAQNKQIEQKPSHSTFHLRVKGNKTTMNLAKLIIRGGGIGEPHGPRPPLLSWDDLAPRFYISNFVKICLSNTIIIGSIVKVNRLLKKNSTLLLTCTCSPHFEKGSSTSAHNALIN